MKKQRRERNLRFGTAFFLCLLVSAGITAAYVRNMTRTEYAQMEQLVTVNANKVGSVLTKLLYKTQALAALVIQSDGKVENFAQVAANVMDDPCIRNVIIAPKGVVSEVYPLEGNEEVIGFDYFSDGEGNQEAQQAKETGQLVLGGPFHLVQGGQALVGRLPVYLTDESGGKKFFGLVSVTLDYPDALKDAELEQLKNQGFAYEIWRISPDTGEKQIISSSDYQYDKGGEYVETELSILNADWYFRLSPVQKWYQYPETWLFVLAGAIISFLIAALVAHNYELRQVQKELEEMSCKDALTGALNRRGIHKELDELVRHGKMKFLLCYLDLNRFKRINDTYGHDAGDKVLARFAEIMMKRTDKNHLFARIGGDEFILILKNESAPEAAERFLAQAEGEMSRMVLSEEIPEMKVTCSMGVAVYPEDGRTADALMEKADLKMYEEKEKK